jgi:hypothetical protein
LTFLCRGLTVTEQHCTIPRLLTRTEGGGLVRESGNEGRYLGVATSGERQSGTREPMSPDRERVSSYSHKSCCIVRECTMFKFMR